jgi:hypothetical protein
MAYFIFLKYLDSLEDFMKNPHVKIPLLLQIFKALVYSKFKFLFGKDFFLHFRPNRPSS